MTVVHIFGWVCVVLACAGTVYAALAVWFTGRFGARATPPATDFPPMTLLKPLHGAEPSLADNLESFFTQDYPAPFQIVFGVQDPNDGAIAVVEALKQRFPQVDSVLVVDTRRRAANPKVANLINMEEAIRHGILVLSDSDIAVERDYLQRIAATLAPQSVGGATCVYTGWGASGFVSQLSAMGVSYHFLPNVMAGLGFKMAQPCFGSTIAIKGALFRESGGFSAFANQLADDHAMGMAVRNKGYTLAIPPFAVRHASTETAWREWFFHELRWMRTIRTVDPGGHAGSIVTHAFPLALLGFIFSAFAPFTAYLLIAAFLVRAVLKWRIDRVFGQPAGPLWLLPLRDVLSFCVFLASLFGGSVVWQNEHLTVREDGALNSVEFDQSVRK